MSGEAEEPNKLWCFQLKHILLGFWFGKEGQVEMLQSWGCFSLGDAEFVVLGDRVWGKMLECRIWESPASLQVILHIGCILE